MIEWWWIILPFVVMYFQSRLIVRMAVKVRDEKERHIATMDELEKTQRHLLRKAKELTAIYTDIRDATKVNDVHGFLIARIEARGKSKHKEKT